MVRTYGRVPDSAVLGPLGTSDQAMVLTIQPMPNRSVSMPKRGDQKVFVNGIRHKGPWDSASLIRALES